jgi:phosphoglycolate phosphatase
VFYKAILFDLDGTLLNTLEDLADAVNRVLDQRGFPMHPLDAYRYFVGDGSLLLVKRALPVSNRDDAELVASCLAAFLDEYGRNWMVKTRPYDGVATLLDALTERGLKMVVLSNKKDEITKKTVSLFLSKWRFDAVVGQREEVPTKPDPAGAIEIVKLLGIVPGEFVYVGDTAVDMKTAVAAGMLPVGALWGFRNRKELLEGGACALISRPVGLLEVLEARP